MTPGEAFHTLGISPGSSRSRGHAAYRELVKLWHPDRYSPGSPLRAMAEQNTLRANLAWKTVQPLLAPEPPRQRPGGPPRPWPRGAPPPAAEPLRWRAITYALARLFQRFRPLLERFKLTGCLRWLAQEGPSGHRPWWRYPDPDSPAPGRQPRPRHFEEVLAETLGGNRVKGPLPGSETPGQAGHRPPAAAPRASGPVEPPGPVTPVRPSRRSGRVDPMRR